MQNLTNPKRTASTTRLPPELLYHVLDQLVATRDGRQPIAYEPSNDITKTLRALTLVSRSIYPIASKYLYSNCLYLRSHKNFDQFRWTLSVNLGPSHTEALGAGDAVRNGQLWNQAKISQNITSIVISLLPCWGGGRREGPVRLLEIIDLCKSIGTTLRRLALDFHPVKGAICHIPGVFIDMPQLEELILGEFMLDCFRYPMPSLKRLVIAADRTLDSFLDFIRLIPSLEVLILLRPSRLICADIEALFSAYHGKRLDVVFVDVNSNHRTPKGTRSWKEDDVVRVWEIDVPTSFYGDDDNEDLCYDYIWTHGVDGTLWSHERRRMASWAEIERRLAGPVHTIVDGSHP